MPRVPYNDPKVNAYSLPVALAAVLVAKITVIPDGIFWYFFSIPMHEMGHSVAALLGGRFALPLGAIIPMAGFSAIGLNRSILVYFGMTGLLGSAAYLSWKEEKAYAFLLCVALLCVQNYLTWLVPADRWMMFTIFFGVGGEFLLSTLLMVSFYFQMPDRLRWDFFRFVFLFIGAYCFVSVFRLWIGFASHPGEIPWGSFLNGNGDAGGDMARLRDQFHWSTRDITGSYLRLGKWGTGIVLVTYLVFLKGGFKEELPVEPEE